jgi:hypothetical protein
MSQILAIENIVTEYAGPLAKFVIKKQVADIGIDEEEEVSLEQLKQLVERVVEKSIFDPRLRKEALIKLKKQMHLYEDID